MSLQVLEQKVKMTILGSILGIGVLGSGCETPEDHMLVSALLGLSGLNPNLTSQQVIAVGIGRDLAHTGAGVAAQRESSKRIAGAIQGRYGTDNYGTLEGSQNHKRFQTEQFGLVEIYFGKTPLGYTGQSELQVQEIALQDTFTKADSLIVVCRTEHKMRNMILKEFNEMGKLEGERLLSEGCTTGYRLTTNLKDIPYGRHTFGFYAMPSAVIPKYQNTTLFLGSIEFTVKE